MTWLLIVLAIVLFDALFVFVLVSTMVRKGWNELAGRYPAQPPAPNAVERTFQSFKLGLLNLGYCIHVAVDDRYLHLTPAKVIRAFGAESTSIPWDAMELRQRSRRGLYTTVTIDKQQLMGPSWCLDLVEPPAESHSQS